MAESSCSCQVIVTYSIRRQYVIGCQRVGNYRILSGNQESPKQCLFIVELIIHPDRSLMIVFVDRNGLNHESTRTGPGGKLCGDLHRRGAEQGGTHLVACEWPSQVQLLTVLTLRRRPV